MEPFLNFQLLAERLNLKERQIHNLVQKGMPSQKDGRNRVFDWPEVLEWFVEYRIGLAFKEAGGDTDDEDASDAPQGKEDIRRAMLRKTTAEADLKQLALSKLRGEVITIADAKVRLERMLGNLRSALLGMAPKLSGRLEGLRDRTAREAVIKEEMEVLCRELATGAIVDLPEEGAKASTDYSENYSGAALDTLQASAAELDPLAVLLTPDEYLDLTLELAERYAAALQ